MFKDGSLIIQKGTKANHRIKDYLERFGVGKIDIVEIREKNQAVSYLWKKFHENIISIAYLKRYELSSILQNNDIDWLEEMFTSFMSQPFVSQKMSDLDEYSYVHSFDVFLLGACFAKYLEMENIEDFAIGCLLHDIGKCHIPQEILNKESNLTEAEYKIIQKHTLYGQQWIQENVNHGLAAEMAKSHHERLDGSGYPEGLLGDRLGEKIKMLMIVDVFSALTLKRPYKKAKHPDISLEIMFHDHGKFDIHLLKRFCNMLEIYPKGSVVALSNGTNAKVMYVPANKPEFPLLQNSQGGNNFYLPTDFSIRIIDFVYFSKKDTEDKIWNNYLASLLSGQKEEAIFYFEKLADNLKVEEIYTNIFSKAMKQIGEQWQNNEITVAEEHISSVLTAEIMDYKVEEYKQAMPKLEEKIVFTTVGNEQHLLPLKIVADTFTVNGWNVYDLLQPTPKEDILSFLEKYNIPYLGISVTMEENISKALETILFLKEKKEDLTILVGGRVSHLLKENKEIIVFNNISEATTQLNKLRLKQ